MRRPSSAFLSGLWNIWSFLFANKRCPSIREPPVFLWKVINAITRDRALASLLTQRSWGSSWKFCTAVSKARFSLTNRGSNLLASEILRWWRRGLKEKREDQPNFSFKCATVYKCSLCTIQSGSVTFQAQYPWSRGSAYFYQPHGHSWAHPYFVSELQCAAQQANLKAYREIFRPTALLKIDKSKPVMPFLWDYYTL